MNCAPPTEIGPATLKAQQASLKRIIVTGDDFGLALPVNEAIVEASRKGILTGASLMMGASYASDAVKRAREHPELRVGLHLTLVEGRPVLDPQRIPDLVDRQGEFSARLARSGFRFFFQPGVRKQLEAEIRAQFEAFSRTGLELDHADAHNHMHLHPTVLGLMVDVGREYGLKSVRVPNEPGLLSWKASRTSLASRLTSWLFLLPWIARMKHVLRRAGVRHNDFLFGMADSGTMNERRLVRMIAHLPRGVTELCFHPATRRSEEIDLTMPEYRHEEEFKALTSASVIEALYRRGARLIAFGDLWNDASDNH